MIHDSVEQLSRFYFIPIYSDKKTNRIGKICNAYCSPMQCQCYTTLICPTSRVWLSVCSLHLDHHMTLKLCVQILSFMYYFDCPMLCLLGFRAFYNSRPIVWVVNSRSYSTKTTVGYLHLSLGTYHTENIYVVDASTFRIIPVRRGSSCVVKHCLDILWWKTPKCCKHTVKLCLCKFKIIVCDL